MNRIKELREEKGLSQEELGKHLNVQKSAVSKYEKEHVSLNNDLIRELVKLFNVSSDYLLGISDDRDSDIKTIAAHHDGDTWTEEELEEIEKFKAFVRSKRLEKEDKK